MITLITGVPGAAKTLNTLVMVEAERRGRTVYYSGIRDCRIPGWQEFGEPGKAVDRDGTVKTWETDASEWYKLPVGSIVVIDEAQRLFRPRHYAKDVPAFEAELETHRHAGIDLYLITQNPQLISANVRRLGGRHFHYVRPFGLPGAHRYEWGEVREDVQSRNDAHHAFIKHPRHAYAWYKSAEVHTHRVRFPRTHLYALLGVVFLVGVGVYAYRHFRDLAINPTGTAKPASLVDGKVSGKVPARKAPESTRSPQDWLASFTPRVVGLPHTAPAYDGVMAPQEAPVPAACVLAEKKGCRCYTNQATRIDMPDELCRTIVERGFFNPARQLLRADAARSGAPAANEATPVSSPSPVASPQVGAMPNRPPGRWLMP